MIGDAVLLQHHDRKCVEDACQCHGDYRREKLLAVNARTNHVHVGAIVDLNLQKARDQLKANCTQALRKQSKPLIRDRTRTRGGDCHVLESDDAVTAAVMYVLEGQD